MKISEVRVAIFNRRLQEINCNIFQPAESTVASVEEPVHDISDLYGIVGEDLKKTFDIREVIARIVDGSKFDEFKAKYGETLVCGKWITFN